MKTCNKCAELKDEKLFYKRKGHGTYNTCATCWQQHYIDPVRGTIQEKDRERRTKPKARFITMQRRAKKSSLEITITFEEYQKLIILSCHYCNNKLGNNLTGGGLDRVDSFKGYIINNVVPCCTFCNTIKWNLLSHDEMIKIAALIIKERNL